MEEVWKDIEGYEGLYQVSSLGRVKSLKRLITRKYGYKKREQRINEKLLRFSNNSKGYSQFKINKLGKQKTFRAHTLVARAFIPNHKKHEEINHKNGIKTDNRVENLEWCTRQENIDHAWKKGLVKNIQNGEKINTSKLTEKQVLEIREKYGSKKCNYSEIARKYNVWSSTISRVINKETWKHVLLPDF